MSSLTLTPPIRDQFFTSVTNDIDSVEETPPQHPYIQAMEYIWEKVSQLPEGQNKVVLSQIWAFGKVATPAKPDALPALAAHDFIVEQQDEERTIWQPCSPFLKDFWRIGITVSNAYGFSLQPLHAFQANLQATSRRALS